jgi:hypothetical protein
MPCGVDDEVERESHWERFSGGGGPKMRQRRSFGSGTGDIETVPSEPKGVAGSSKTTSSTPVRLRCRTLSEYVEPERHRILTTRMGWL